MSGYTEGGTNTMSNYDPNVDYLKALQDMGVDIKRTPTGFRLGGNDDPDDMQGDCEICGERYDVRSPLPSISEIGEFVEADGTHVITHAECGVNAGLELA
jgi:hypothetical protein